MRRLDKEDDDEEATARRRRQRKKTPSTDSCGSICVVTVLLVLVCWCVSPVLAGVNSDTGVATSPFANTTSLYSSMKLGSRLVRRRDRHPDQEQLSVNETDDEVTTTPLPGCQSCIFREGLRNLSLQTIKEEILSKLGMKHAPNTTGRQLPKIPPLHHLLQIYEQQQGVPGMQGDEPVRATGSFKPGSVVQEEEDDYHARTERVIAFAQPYPKLRHGPKGQDVQFFRFSEKVMRNRVLKAHLWMYLRGTTYRQGSKTSHEGQADAPAPESPGGGYDGGGGGGGDAGWSVPLVNVSVMKVLRGASSSLESPIMKIEAKSLVRRPSGEGGWVSLNVEELLSRWFENPKENHGIVLHAVDEHDRQIVVTDHEEDSGALVPFVELYTADGRKHRTKRTIGLNCDETSEEKRCCRYPLTVDFEEFGWDWIIAPKKYEANYCSGECPYVFLQKYPHTHIVALANPSGTAGPCCAPRKMSPISMLYFDNEYNIIYGLLPGMVVDRCGCS